MSQSPIDDASPDATRRYAQGWAALSRLLHEDRSFSGHERNCAFLNTGGGRFADVSAASGLDFDDDGRGLAVVDWDFDGDLDLWTTCRTAPRVRYLRNDNNSGNHFLAVKLRGNGAGTNRDAIGARLNLYLSGEKTPQIRSLHAGDGFLSQSSKWIHFGLGSKTKIDRLVIRWPGGKDETIDGVQADRFYTIKQGSGRAAPWSPPAERAKLIATAPSLPKSTERARIVLPSRLPLPEIRLIEEKGKEAPLKLSRSGPVLINLWGSSCRACLVELSEWADQEERIRSASLTIVALSVDGLEDAQGDRDSASDFLKRIDFPFQTGWISKQGVRHLDLFQRAMLDRWRPMPVPSSFLLDQHGRVAVIYKGPIKLERLLDDVALLDDSPAMLRDQAAAFFGRWVPNVTLPLPDPDPVVSQFNDNDEAEASLGFLRRFVTAPPAVSTTQVGRGRINDSYFAAHVNLALGLVAKNEFAEAGGELAQALRYKPSDKTVLGMLGELGVAQFRRKQYAAAIDSFARLVKAQPDNATAYFHLANAYRASGNFPTAIGQYRRTLSIDPKMYLAANNLAWILATHTDADLRDGAEAVRWAKIACEASRYQQPLWLDTLAAAYAEAEQFDQAVKTLTQAIALAAVKADSGLQNQLLGRLELYKAGKPYRDSTDG